MGWKKRASVKTGRRNISAQLREGVTGIAMVSRTDDIVVLNLYGILPPEEVSAELVDVFQSGIPAGFRPDRSMTHLLVVTDAAMPPFMPRVFMSESGRCSVNRPGSPVYGVAVYRTEDRWPT